MRTRLWACTACLWRVNRVSTCMAHIQPVLQACACDDEPVHGVPQVPPHERFWVCIPVPHVLLHAPHALQGDQLNAVAAMAE